jgi:hypothetical protein
VIFTRLSEKNLKTWWKLDDFYQNLVKKNKPGENLVIFPRLGDFSKTW